MYAIVRLRGCFMDTILREVRSKWQKTVGNYSCWHSARHTAVVGTEAPLRALPLTSHFPSLLLKEGSMHAFLRGGLTYPINSFVFNIFFLFEEGRPVTSQVLQERKTVATGLGHSCS